jgi:hypothetical protein
MPQGALHSAEGASARSWAQIISAVKGPLGLVTLLALLAEAPLAVVAARSEGTNQTLIIGGMIFALLWLVLAGTFFLWHQMKLDAASTQSEIEVRTADVRSLRNQIRALRDEKENLQRELDQQKADFSTFTDLREQVRYIFNTNRVVGWITLVSGLGVSENDRARGDQIRAMIVDLLRRGEIEKAPDLPDGYWRLAGRSA